LAHREAHTHAIDDKGAFYEFFTPQNSSKPEIHGGFAQSHWCGSPDCEAKIKEDLTVTIRCLPFDAEQAEGRCIVCGAPSPQRVVFAKAY
jgi:prolyl-tRNA synthetase